MDTRLKFKWIITILACFIIVSCKTNKNLNSDIDHYYGTGFPHNKKVKYNKQEGEAMVWIWEFKQHVFYDCLFENYKNDSIFKLMGKEDLMNPSNYIPMTFWPKIKQVGKDAIRYMPENYYFTETEEDKKRNYISRTCLDYFTSRELDSIAKSEFKKYLKDKSTKYQYNN